MGGERYLISPVFGLFTRSTPRQSKVALEDIETKLKRKQQELREIEKTIANLEKQAKSSASLDQHIAEQQARYADLKHQAVQTVREFKSIQDTFSSRQDMLLKKEKQAQEQGRVLEEKRSLLAIKEKSLREREDAVEEATRKAEALGRALQQAEAPLAQKRERIARQIKDAERQLQELKSARTAALQVKERTLLASIKAVEQRLLRIKAERGAAERELANCQQDARTITKKMPELLQVGRELVQVRMILDKKANALNAKTQILAQQEQELAAREKEANRKLATYEEAKRTIAHAEHMKFEAERAIKDKMQYGENIRRITAENNKRLMELHNKEDAAQMLQSNLVKRQQDVDEKLAKLDRKEKSLVQREVSWLDHQNQLKDLAEQLEKTKPGLEQFIGECKGSLANLKQEWDDKVASLRDEKEFLSSQKSEISRLAKSDIAVLDEKEQEVLGLVKELEKDQARLAKEEKAVVARVRELDRARAALAAHETRLIREQNTAKNILAAADKARALKASLPGLKSETARFTKEIAKLEKIAKKGGARIIRIVREKPVFRQRPVIVKRKREEPVMRQMPRGESPVVSTAKDDLQVMIEEAKASIQAGDVAAASKTLDLLESAARKLSDDERRQLSYEIKDLRTSIKLATL